MGFINYDNYDDTGHLFHDNFVNNEDSTFDLVEYGPRHQSGSLFNEIESNLGDSLFEYDVEKLHIRTNIHPLDRRLMKKAFKCLVLSYHESVRDSLLDSLSLMYNRRRYVKVVVNAFLVPARKKRLKEMLSYAESYSLREFLYGWRLQALTLNEVKSNEVKAKLYYESALSFKYLCAFRALAKQNNLKNYKLLRMVVIVRKVLYCNILKPWNDATKKSKRLELCQNDIAKNRDSSIKHLAFNSIFKLYNHRVGIYILTYFVEFYLKRQALKQLRSFYEYMIQNQASLEKKVNLIRVERFFDHWRFLSLYKLSNSLYEYKIKSKSLTKLKAYASRKAALRRKRDVLIRQLNEHRQDLVLRELVNHYMDKKRTQSSTLTMVGVVDRHLKARFLRALYENHKRLEREAQKNMAAETFRRNLLFNKALVALSDYSHGRVAKRQKMALASMNYNRYLWSYVFEHLLSVHRQRENRNRQMVARLDENRNRTLRRQYFKALRAGIGKMKRLSSQYDSIWTRYNVYLANTVFQTLQHIINVNHRRKLLLIASVLNHSGAASAEESHGDELEVSSRILNSSKLSVNLLLASTKPLPSEGLSFLLYLLTLKSKYNEVYYSYFSKNEDELLNKLLQSLTSSDLAQIKSKYSLVLHETRLLYLPKQNSYGSDMSQYFEHVPEEMTYLLQYLVLDTIFNMKTALVPDEPVSGWGKTYIETEALNGYTLLKLPLWRLINLKLLACKKRKMLQAWREMVDNKLKKRQADAEYREIFGDMSAMFTKITFFDHWAQLTKLVVETRNELELRRSEEFHNRLNRLVQGRKAIGYILLYLNYVGATYQAPELSARVKLWHRSFLRNNPDISDAAIPARYLSVHRIFNSWKNFSLWYSKIKRDAKDFSRINMLVKSFKMWFTATAHNNTVREEVGQTIRLAADSILKQAALDAWYKLAALNRILAGTNSDKKLLEKCLHAWKTQTQTALDLRCKYEEISSSYNASLMSVYLFAWHDQFSCNLRSRTLHEAADRHFYATTTAKYMATWMAVAERKVLLRDCEAKIRHSHARSTRLFYFKALHCYWKFAVSRRNGLIARTFSTLRTLAFASKLTRLVETRLERSTGESVREFYNLLRANCKFRRECENIAKNHKHLYSVLFRLSDINRDRVVQGLRVLNMNAYYTKRFKLVRRRANDTLAHYYFSIWKAIASRNRAWLDVLEHVYPALQGIQGPLAAAGSEHKPVLKTEKHHQLKLLRLKYLLTLYSKALRYWKSKCYVLDTSDQLLDRIYTFSQTSRLIQALRVLQENFMDRRWSKVCAFRASTFANARNLKLKSLVFRHFKSLVRLNLDQLLVLEDLESVSDAQESDNEDHSALVTSEQMPALVNFPTLSTVVDSELLTGAVEEPKSDHGPVLPPTDFHVQSLSASHSEHGPQTVEPSSLELGSTVPNSSHRGGPSKGEASDS